MRVPSFFEPHWYGDEEIYLAIGQALNKSAILYRDIWDNKTPLLYLIYAISPSIIWAKVSATFFVLGTCTGMYALTKSIFDNSRNSVNQQILLTTKTPIITTLLTGIFLSIPLFEGTIANAELYFTCAIIFAALIIYRLNFTANNFLKHILVGILFSFSFFLKVPAIFDFLGFFLYLFVVLFDTAKTSKFPFLSKYAASYIFIKTLQIFTPIILVFLTTFAMFIFYFNSHGALKDFFTASFSQNASYVAVDSGPLSQLSNPLFTKGMLLLLTLLILFISFLRKSITKELLFLTLWFSFSLYGALLSNRPYMHYLLQTIPPAILLLCYLVLNIKKFWYWLVFLIWIFYVLFRQFLGAFALPTIEYYQNWADYVLQKKSWVSYANFFDGRTTNSYNLASYLSLNTKETEPIFVWGDAASIYVISNRLPATKYIQAHHLTTIDKSNYDLIIQRLSKIHPKFIIVSRPTFEFAKLEELLKKDYEQVRVFDYLYVYKSKIPTSPTWSINY